MFKGFIPDGTKFRSRSSTFRRWQYTNKKNQNLCQLNNQKLKTMVKRCMDQKIRARYFEARNERLETRVLVKTCKGTHVCVDRKQRECYQWKAQRQFTKGNACIFRHDENKRGKATQSSSPAPKAQTQNDGKSYLKGKSLRGRSPSGKGSRRPCKDYLSGMFRILPTVNITKHNRDANSVKGAHSGTERLTFSPTRSRRKVVAKVLLSYWRIPSNLVAYSRNVEPLKSKSILRKGTKSLGPKRSMQFSKRTLRHDKFRERKGPSQGVIQHACPHKLKEKDKAAFYSPSDVWCTCCAGAIWTLRNWTPYGHPETLQRLLKPTVKCKQVRRRLRSWFIRDSTNPRGYARSPMAWKTLRRSRIFLWVDQWSRTTDYQIRNKSSVFEPSALKCMVSFPFSVLRIPRLNALALVKTGWHVSLKRCTISATELHFPSGRYFDFPYHFLSSPGPRNVLCPLREFLRVRLVFFWFRNTNLVVSITCPINIVEHWHEGDPTCEFFSSVLANHPGSFEESAMTSILGKYATRIQFLLHRFPAVLKKKRTFWILPLDLPIL